MVRWTLISARRLGFARGALRRRSDRGEIGVLFGGAALTAAAVPVGDGVEEWVQGVAGPDEAAVAALGAVMLWMLVVTAVVRGTSAVLERRRIAEWGREWQELQ